MISALKSTEVYNQDLLYLGKLFYEESKLPGCFNGEHFAKTWAFLIEKGIGAIWVATVGETIIGAIGGLVHPDICSGDIVAQEAFWFIHPEQRGGTHAFRLYYKLEEWANAKEAKRLCMSSTLNAYAEKLQQMYMKLGYNMVDICYVKAL